MQELCILFTIFFVNLNLFQFRLLKKKREKQDEEGSVLSSQDTEWIGGGWVGKECRLSCRYVREVFVSRCISAVQQPPVHAFLIGSSWNVSMERVWRGREQDLGQSSNEYQKHQEKKCYFCSLSCFPNCSFCIDSIIFMRPVTELLRYIIMLIKS